MASIKLGELLVKAKVLSDGQLKAALSEQSRWGGKLGEILVRMNAMTEEMLVKALSKQTGIASVNLDAITSVPPHVKARISAQLARDLNVLPLQLRDEGRTLIVAMADPTNIDHIDTLRSVSRCRIQVQLAGRSAIARAWGRIYEEGEEMGEAPEGSLKFVDAQGNTMVKGRDKVAQEYAEKKATHSSSLRSGVSAVEPEQHDQAVAAPAPAIRPPAPAPAPAANGPDADAVMATLKGLEDVQRKEITVLRSMVELMIEKGIFTREEYLAKVKR